jgi:hypothetical protein
MDTWEWEGGGRRRGHLAKRKAVVPSTKRTGPYPGVIPYWYTVHAPEGLSRGKKTGINSGDKKQVTVTQKPEGGEVQTRDGIINPHAVGWEGGTEMEGYPWARALGGRARGGAKAVHGE